MNTILPNEKSAINVFGCTLTDAKRSFPNMAMITKMTKDTEQLWKTFRLGLVARKFCQHHLIFKRYKLDERVLAP